MAISLHQRVTSPSPAREATAGGPAPHHDTAALDSDTAALDSDTAALDSATAALDSATAAPGSPTGTAQPLAGRRERRYEYADLPDLMALMSGDSKHDLAAASTIDVLWVLYDRVLRVSPQAMNDDGRDRFFLSKGHGPMAYYAVLAAKGFLDPVQLPGFADFHSVLGRHPDRMLAPGVEISSGSLGHGLPLAVGSALGLRARGLTQARVFVLVGDGELDEGSNTEAIAFARAAGLDRLHVVAVENASSTHGWPGGIETRFAVEGWSALRVSGRDHAALEAAFTAPHPGRPHVVVAAVEAENE